MSARLSAVLPGLATVFMALLLGGCATLSGMKQTDPLIVSAASSLTPAFQEIGARFEADTGIPVTFNFASSGKLAQQIEEGAPVDIFAAANVSYMDELDAQGLILADTRTRFARGQLTLWTGPGNSLPLARIEELAGPEVDRVAIANPDHAPYGVAAREALQNAGGWVQVQPKLIFGENIAQTLQLAETGGVEAALMARSLSLTSDGHWVPVPDELYTPLDQELAVVAGTQNEAAARRFADYMVGPEAQRVLRDHGFAIASKERTE